MSVDASLIKAHEEIIYSYCKTPSKNKAQSPQFHAEGNLPLIELVHPLIPTPWSSKNEGDGWIWDKYILALQKEPIELGIVFSEDREKVLAIRYPYSMVVFYHPEKSPHYPSKRPILVLSIEQTIHSLGVLRRSNPFFLGMYHQNGLEHSNFGEYNKEIDDPYEIKECFFTFLCNYLKLPNQPKRIGNLKETSTFLGECIDKELGKSGQPSSFTELKTIRDSLSALGSGKLNKEEAKEIDAALANKLNMEQVKEEYPPTDIFSRPTMPMPMHSEDDGEFWTWGGYLCFFQKRPRPVYKFASNNQGPIPDLMIYHYCLSIFSKDSFEDTSGIYSTMIITLEQMSKDLGGQAPYFLGIFHNQTRENLGMYTNGTHPEQIITKFFQIAKERLKLVGEPKYSGTITEHFPNFVNSLKPEKT